MADKKEIIWSPRARRNYRAIISYLANEWSEKEITSFVNKTSVVLSTISSGIATYKKSIKPNHFEVIVTKHNLLIYRVKGKKIELVAFYDTRQHPLKKKI